MACGEYGPGRLPEPAAILHTIASHPAIGTRGGSLKGKHILVTAGTTHEPIDPVRVLANRSSGKQGFAIAKAAAALGARVTLVAGPVALPTPPGVDRVDVETALQMQAAVQAALPADAAIMVAAVADWRAEPSLTKIKKSASSPPALRLVENPDLLAELALSPLRPPLLIGFAAETDEVLANAKAKLARKGCDWILANDVSGDVMGGDSNQVHVVTKMGVESWDRLSKADVAKRLIEKVAAELGDKMRDAH
jgi:phosphopantothenoylcysteine decarboxylase/phosphopantothenate--cysteine ligase